jgi:hypothetical protein
MKLGLRVKFTLAKTNKSNDFLNIKKQRLIITVLILDYLKFGESEMNLQLS